MQVQVGVKKMSEISIKQIIKIQKISKWKLLYDEWCAMVYIAREI